MDEETTASEEVVAEAPQEGATATDTEPVVASEPVEDVEATAEAEDTNVSTIDNLEDALAALETTRKENAATRVKNRELSAKVDEVNSFFEDTDEDYRKGWLELAKAFKEDPESVRDIFAELAKAGIDAEEVIEELEEEEAGTTETESVANAEQELTSRITDIFSRRQAQLEANAAQAQVELEIKELGYDKDTDTDSYDLLMSAVRQQPEGSKDLKSAHEAVLGLKQRILDAGLAALKAGKGSTPPVGKGAGLISDAEEEESDSNANETAYDKHIRLAGQFRSAPRGA